LEASNVEWSVSVMGGMLGLIDFSDEGTFATIDVKDEKTATAKWLFGLGKINITAIATATSSNTATKTVNGFILGPLVFAF
ncbi:MAG: hypothetical protein ACOC5T_07995, partial [Elusimicrobiota bacterium]